MVVAKRNVSSCCVVGLLFLSQFSFADFLRFHLLCCIVVVFIDAVHCSTLFEGSVSVKTNFYI